MTEEIKICKRFTWTPTHLDLETGESWKEPECWSFWKELDPQPCCKKCKSHKSCDIE